jgi:hypothetical protein
MHLKSGFYDDGETFASSLTHQVARAFADIPDIVVKFTFDKRLDRIRMQIRNSPETTVIFSADLLEFMGFPRKMIVLKELDRVGPKPFDVNRGLNLMYVYCDAASHGIVGDINTPPVTRLKSRRTARGSRSTDLRSTSLRTDRTTGV